MSERTKVPGRSPDRERPAAERVLDPLPASSALAFGDAAAVRRYRVLMELGRGGMGVVSLAMARGPRGFVKLVVLKSLHPELLHDEQARVRLLDEARIAARLSHPNIAQVFEVLVERETPTIVMEYLEGQSLWTVLEVCEARLPLPVHSYVLVQALAGLHAAHGLCDFAGVPLELVHRDVSPHNVLLTYDGQVKVLDFGIATTVASEVETRPGVAGGKPQYMAPEQLRGGAVDRRADVFSVGVMLYEAATGARFWGAAGDGEIARRLLEHDVPRLEQADVASSLCAIVNRATAAEPDQRYATAEELQRALEGELAGVDVHVLREQLAAFMRQHFRQARRTMEQLVQSHVALASEPPPRLDRASASPEAPPRSRTAGRVLALSALLAGAGLAAVLIGKTEPSATMPSCGPEQKACAGACVSIDRPEYGCGTSACRPCLVPNATARCDFAHQCAIAVCNQDHDDCDGDPRNGCETAVRVDPDHCGGCGNRCPELPHAERGCGDACTIWRCAPGHADCDERVDDGCEIETSTDVGHCGGCNEACRAGERCLEGVCRP